MMILLISFKYYCYNLAGVVMFGDVSIGILVIVVVVLALRVEEIIAREILMEIDAIFLELSVICFRFNSSQGIVADDTASMVGMCLYVVGNARYLLGLISWKSS